MRWGSTYARRRARGGAVSFPTGGAEPVVFNLPGGDLRWVAHVLDALAHRWGEASAKNAQGPGADGEGQPRWPVQSLRWWSSLRTS